MTPKKRFRHEPQRSRRRDNDDQIEKPVVKQRRSSFPPPKDDNAMSLMTSIHEKIIKSPALNGGFDNVMYKLKKIEDDQEKIGTNVAGIHDAIYHPDEGIFARIKDVENVKKQVEVVSALETDVMKLQQRIDLNEKDAVRDRRLIEENDTRGKTHGDQLKELSRVKDRFGTVSKWLLLTLAGGSATLIGKLLISYFSSHVSFN